MQNVCLSKITVQEMFYWRQLLVSVFCILHDLTEENQQFFCIMKNQMKFVPFWITISKITYHLLLMNFIYVLIIAAVRINILSRMLLALIDIGLLPNLFVL